MQINLVKKSDSPFGVDALFSLSYSAAAAADKPFTWRRKMLFSLYCLRCLYDNIDLLDPPALLLQYGCSFLLSPDFYADYCKIGKDVCNKDGGGHEHKNADSAINLDKCGQNCTDFAANNNKIKPISGKADDKFNKAYFDACLKQTDAVKLDGGGLFIDICGQKKLKFDAGSPLFFHFSKVGVIDKTLSDYPDKFGICEAVYLLISLKNCSFQLKGLWFLLLPYLLYGADDLNEYIGKISAELNLPKVFDAASLSEFCTVKVGQAPVFDTENTVINQWFLQFDNLRKTNNYTKNYAYVDERKSSKAGRDNDDDADDGGQVYVKPAIYNKEGTVNHKKVDSTKQGNDILNSNNSDTNNGDSSNFGNHNNSNRSINCSKNNDACTSDEQEQYSKLLIDAEKLFKDNPCKDSLLVLLATRSNLPAQNQTRAMLTDNIRLISGFLPKSPCHLLTYYMGLSFLGLGEIDKAKRTFDICVSLKPDFKPAIEILSRLKNLKS